MKNHIFCIFLLSLLASPSLMKAQVILSKIVPIDSIFTIWGLNRISIKYAQLDSSADFFYANTTIQVKKQYEPNEWIDLALDEDRDIDAQERPISEYLKSKEITLNLFHLFMSDSIVFSEYKQGENIKIRCVTFFRSPSHNAHIPIISNEISFFVPPATNDDASIFEYFYLRRDSFPNLIEFISGYDHSTVWDFPTYEHIVQNFPNSALADVAKFKLRFNECKRNRSQFSSSPNIKTACIQSVEEFSNSIFGYIKEQSSVFKMLMAQ